MPHRVTVRRVVRPVLLFGSPRAVSCAQVPPSPACPSLSRRPVARRRALRPADFNRSARSKRQQPSSRTPNTTRRRPKPSGRAAAHPLRQSRALREVQRHQLGVCAPVTPGSHAGHIQRVCGIVVRSSPRQASEFSLVHFSSMSPLNSVRKWSYSNLHTTQHGGHK